MLDPAILSLIVLMPLFGAIFIGLMGFLNPNFRKQEQLIGAIGTLMVAVPFILVLITFLNYDKEAMEGMGAGFGLAFGEPLGWMFGGNLDIGFTYVLDELSLTMALVVTGVGSLIHVYSIGYMHGDGGFYKFFMYLNLFIFAMLNLVLGDNLVVLFLGWEGVGACSYFLIGFWYTEMKNAKAAQKAFVANRIGDFAMIAAMMLLFTNTGTLSFRGILEMGIDGETAAWVSLLVLIAATGKSAQIPLYVWLPDAMAGPTPVSALIHAATMVTSGIYLIARMGEIFMLSPEVMTFVSCVGGATAILAALIAIAQNDIKKVLAYSTVSQLGFMFMALGAGAFTTAIFHVMTHAFFKACLFLGSGSVIHAMEHMHTVDDPQDIRTMGGLRKYMPATHITFFISTLAISGIPLLSGFFSKDEIMGKVFGMGMTGNWMYFVVWGVGMFTAFLTAFYMTRVYFLTFRGKERFPQEKKPHESPATMTIPLYVLAFLAIVGGFVGLPAVIGHGKYHIFNHWLEGPVELHTIEHIMHDKVGITGEWILIFISIIIAVGGVLIAWRLYKKNDLAGDEVVKQRVGANQYAKMEGKFFVDEWYQKWIIDPFVWLGNNAVMWFDKYIIDGIVNGAGYVVMEAGKFFRRMQTGIVGEYALVLVIGVLAILSFLIFV